MRCWHPTSVRIMECGTNVGKQLATDVGPTLVEMYNADVNWANILPTLAESQLQTCI